jgi:alkanesulfonate monooxygenase SsuD/methylene tetrahydromethanopterin reductase-like flavin-dependent oxidoreductase (luciferase family)
MGVDARRRGRLADEHLDLLVKLLDGAPVLHDGRRIHVTPSVATVGRPVLMIAGGSKAAVKRAARHGLGFVAQTNNPELLELFDRESRAHGHEPGFTQFPDGTGPTTTFVADDADGVEKAWGPNWALPSSRRGDGGLLPPRRRLGRQHHPRGNRGRAA